MSRIILLCTVLCWSKAFTQDDEGYCHLIPIYNSQKLCYEKLPAKDTIFYRTLIDLAPEFRPWVISAIELEDTGHIICRSSHFNWIEGISKEGDGIYGIIWTDSIYYSYITAQTTGAFLSKRAKAKKKLFSELSEDEKEIVVHFSNWNNEIFRNTRKSPRFSTNPLYYFGSSMRFEDDWKIESIAFCY